MGLETSKRGLQTQQSALYTTGHNIDNANTLGYTRQRVNMRATAGFPGVGLNAGTMPGFLGTGVEAGSIQRIRDSFVDQQYRGETNRLGYWDARSKSIGQIEDIMNEPSEYGLQKSLSQFWGSLQDLATHPENGGTRKVVVERGIAVADSFNEMSSSLNKLKEGTKQEFDIAEKDINSILKQIAGLNQQISSIEPNGYVPNDLYDARDVLIDQLATYLPIEVKNVPSGGNASKVAEGSVTIILKSNKDKELLIVEGANAADMTVNFNGTGDQQTFKSISFPAIDTNGQAINYELTPSDMKDTGIIKSLVNTFGYQSGEGTKGLLPEMIGKIDRMAAEFVKAFNKVHKEGFGIGDNTNTTNTAFFKEVPSGIKAGNMKVSDAIIQDSSLIAASSRADEEGNGDNAKKLGNIQFSKDVDLDGATIQTYFQGIIGQLGVDGEQAAKMQFNSETLLKSVENRRASISSVSLDEEMTDMIKFQQAYNASARMITVVDETLDKIINGMGVVGR